MALPPIRVDIIRRPLRLQPGELWCSACGFDVPAPKFFDDEPAEICPACHRPTLVAAVQVLQPNEFFIAH